MPTQKVNKHTQTICQQHLINCLTAFDHFMGFARAIIADSIFEISFKLFEIAFTSKNLFGYIHLEPEPIIEETDCIRILDHNSLFYFFVLQTLVLHEIIWYDFS